MKIIVDADACPKSALQICQTLGKKYKMAVWTVASFDHCILSDHHIVVGDNSQEADIKIVNITESNDLIITQDWGLAAMVLGKKAHCLSPSGKEYGSGQIEFLLEEREAKAKWRRGGGRTKGPAKRTAEDDWDFAAALERLIQRGKDRDSV